MKHNLFKSTWHIIHNDWERFEHDPAVQLKYHRRMIIFWMINFPVIGILFFGFSSIWVKLGLLVNTFYSLYANWDTEVGAAHGSYASLKAEEISKKQK